MIVGVLTVDVAIFEARTLKDKRRVILSLKDRVRERFNVSVGEVDFQDLAQRSQIGIALVSTDSRVIHAQFDKLVELVRRSRGLTLLDYTREIW